MGTGDDMSLGRDNFADAGTTLVEAGVGMEP